jgi:hypothetical protein
MNNIPASTHAVAMPRDADGDLHTDLRSGDAAQALKLRKRQAEQNLRRQGLSRRASKSFVAEHFGRK